VAQNDDEAEALQRFGRPVEVRPNVFLDHVFATDETRPVPVTRGDPSNHRAVFAGRLLAWKGVHAAVAAMSEPPLSEWTLAFYGDGPERRRLEASVARRGLQTRVTFLGARPRARCARP
jgi:glycosyltransferase involved in cell wall biosynthesis